MTPRRIGSLCTGYGGLDMAVQAVFGGALAWASDIDPGACKIIAHRHPTVPNLGDLTAIDWDQVEPVDIVTGGYPCQPFSLAGALKGTEDERHIWPDIARALRVLRPRLAIFENVANHLRLGFDTVLCDLADLGFDAEWCVVRASEVGAPHPRRRLFILATAQDADREPGDQWRLAAPRQAEAGRPRADAGRRGGTPASHANGQGLAIGRIESDRNQRQATKRGSREPASDAAPDWGRFAPAIARWERATERRAPWATDDRNRLSSQFVEWLMGLPAGHVTAIPGLSRDEQLKALGNGVVPQQAEAAIRLLAARASP